MSATGVVDAANDSPPAPGIDLNRFDGEAWKSSEAIACAVAGTCCCA